MAYSYPEIRAFSGLHLQANSFSTPDGALERAHNVVISKDGIISKCRGFYQYYDPSSDTLNNLAVYQDKLLGIFSDKIGYFTDAGSSPNYTGTRTALTGATVAVTGTRVCRSVQSNRNLYLTTDNGILKLEAYNGTVYKAGAPQALDLRGALYGASGAIANNKIVGWRLIFGRRDANDNLILGAPSEIYTLTNTTGGSRNARLEWSVPSEITSTSEGYFFRLYRSSQLDSASTAIYSDFKLIDERELTSAEITAKMVFYNDDVDDILLGEELYTNQNSREGEAQANYRPPKCEDVALFKGHVLYANCTTRHLLDFNIVDASVLADNDYVEIKIDSTTRRYVGRVGTGNKTVSATSVAGTGTITVTYNSHNLGNGYEVYISNVSGGSLPVGTYTISNITANTFDISSPGNSATGLDFQGVTNGTYQIFQINNSGSASAQLADTARGLIKAINRDGAGTVYAQYASGISDIPGKIRIQAKGFGGAIYVRGNDSTTGGAFSPVLPDSFSSGTQVYSRNDQLPHTFFAAKSGEPEAVPLGNQYPVGARNKALLRVLALRDSSILLKEDGVYRVTGDNVATFTVTALDTTVICVAPSSAQVINNQVVFLSNQGVCLVTENSVQIISRKIEDVIQPILGTSGLSAQTTGIAYESERFYCLTTIEPNGSEASTTYAYNILNDTWVTGDVYLAKQGLVGPSDTLYVVTTAGKLYKERKNQTRLDHTCQNYAVTVVSVAADLMSGVVTSASATPAIGDVILKNDVFTRITSVALGSGSDFTLTFEQATNLVAADSATLYEGFESEIKTAPFHAGLVGRAKQFGQMQVHFRDNAVSQLYITFAGARFGTSEETVWQSLFTQDGWGSAPWGFEGWGEEDNVNLNRETKPAPICRIWIPRYQQRGTFIQVDLIHRQAGEPLNIQAISFAVRGYNERVSL